MSILHICVINSSRPWCVKALSKFKVLKKVSTTLLYWFVFSPKKWLNQSFCLLLHSLLNHLFAFLCRPVFLLLLFYSFMLNSLTLLLRFLQISSLICSTLNYHPLIIFSSTRLFLKAVFVLPRLRSSCAPSSISLSCLHPLHPSEELLPELVPFKFWNTSKQVAMEEKYMLRCIYFYL